MKKALNIFVLVLAVLFTACTDDPFEDLKGSDWQKDRNVLSLLLDGQIGTSVIERNADDATIKVFAKYENIEDFSKVEVKNILLSYGASTSNGIGSTLNFDNADTTSVLSVESGAGEKLDWTISLHPFKSDLEGTWYIKEVAMYCDLFSWESWGWDKTVLITDHLPNSASELDNKLTFTVEGADENGNPFGKFIHEAGNDQEYGDFTHDTYGDYNSRFRKVIIGEGTWLRDFERNLVVLADSRGNEFEFGLSLEGNLIVESAFDPGKFDPKYVAEGGVALTAELPYTPENFDWDTQDYLYEEIANMSKLMWYELTKEYEPQTNNSIVSFAVEGQVEGAVIDEDNSTVSVIISEEGANVSSVKITDLGISYGSVVDKDVEESLDFSLENTATITVTSESGEARVWTIKLTLKVEVPEGEEPVFVGTWNISEVGMYCDIFLSDGWGWDKNVPITDYLPAANPELDNTITFVYEGVNGDGKAYGSYENNSGTDGQFGNYVSDNSAWAITDFNNRYRKVPTGTGSWVKDGDKVLITVGEGVVFELLVETTSETEIALTAEVEHLKGSFVWNKINEGTDQEQDLTDYAYNEIAFMSNKMWYNLTKQ
ncbi:hypothetical protein [Saccharicrinis aurantiacus]|uniref:hypothetical protein n=1 Tax=Saccharicrinis aurantiacus TaxID=1849719 RepID=UPI002492683B|nr:hypothetical protein [Saccharicrinis aurantiacus]